MVTRLRPVFVIVPFASLAGGCAFLDPAGWVSPVPSDTTVKPATAEPVTSAPVFRLPGTPDTGSPNVVWTAQTGTIGSLGYIEGARRMQVRGYGLVVGLEGRGSARRSASQYLEQELKRMKPAELGDLYGIPAAELLRSTDTAAVLVEGEIRAGAIKDSTFDVTVRPLDREVRNLLGGVLLPCRLRMFLSQETPVEGRSLAKASGRVFTNPFARGDAAAGDGEPGRGRILGGGITTEDRHLQIVLGSPSYPMVQTIVRLLNDRFGASPKTADGVSPTNIKLTVPRSYRGRESRFIELVLHMPLAESAEMREMRAKALSDELGRVNAPLEDTALCLEAIGQAAVPLVRNQYRHRQRATSFYAARVGARLGDSLAIEALRWHAEERDGLYRQAAVRELGETPAYQSGFAVASILRKLLEDDDPRVRVWAYEALRKQHDAVVTSRAVGGDNFLLDVVACDGPGLIHAQRTGERRIAILGRSLRCRPPLLYSHPDRPVTISARNGDERITLVRKLGGGQVVWEPIYTSFAVDELLQVLGSETTRGADGRPRGLAVDYAIVLDVVSELCRTGAIPADFRLEQASVTDLLGPAEPMIRPESDEL